MRRPALGESTWKLTGETVYPDPGKLAAGFARAGFFQSDDLEWDDLSDSVLETGPAFSGPTGIEDHPETFGPYRILGVLGRGGMGVVYRAAEPETGREVALKVLLGDASPQRVKRLQREGTITAALRHPGIVRIHAAGHVDGLPYLAYELVEDARTLQDVLYEGALWHRVELVLQATQAVAYAHARDVLHRDLKPENILIDREGRVRVADFGLGLAIGMERLTQTGQALGTPYYMSPEQFSGKRERVTSAADVWGLGVILYEALTGELPFQGDSVLGLAKAVAGAEPLPPRSLNPSVPPDLEAICLRALAKDVPDRYADAGELAEQLEAALEGAVSTSGRGGLRALLPAGIGLLVVLGLGLPWLLSDPKPASSSSTPGGDGPGPRTSQAPPAWFARLAADHRPKLPLQDGITFGMAPGEYRNLRDESVLVWVPPSRFRMGDDQAPATRIAERPEHEVRISRGFFLGKYEVSWRQYLRFCAATRLKAPSRPPRSLDHPARAIPWLLARAYCLWAGGRLPSEAEWELAARGAAGRRYPWGDTPRPGPARTNLLGLGPDGPSRVDACAAGASRVGCFNMLGNVWEWVHDWYGRYPASEQVDPRGPRLGSSRVYRDNSLKMPLRVVRGGSYSVPFREASATLRSGRTPALPYADAGFRLCRDRSPAPPLPRLTWTGRVFPSEVDPRVNPKTWRTGGDIQSVAFTAPYLHFMFGFKSPTQFPEFKGNLLANHFGLIATTRAELPAGRWAVSVVSDDGVRVRIDGKLHIDRWTHHGQRLDIATFETDGKRPVEIEVEYFELEGYACLWVDLQPGW